MKQFVWMAAIAAFVVPALAAPTGDPFADGWVYQGNSLAQGTYVRGSGNIAFDVYTTSFTVTDSSVYDISGHDGAAYLSYYEANHWTKADARTWEVGDNVIGIGGVFRSVTAAEAGWDEFVGTLVNSTIDNEHRFRLQAKIGTDDATWSASDVAPGNGNGSGGTNDGNPGFLVRTSGWHSLQAWEDFEGTMLGLQKTSHIGGGYDTDVARVIWTWDEEGNRPGSWQILLNTSLMGANYDFIAVIASVQIASGAYTDALANVSVIDPTPIPAPGAILLAGLGTSVVGWLRRRRTI